VKHTVLVAALVEVEVTDPNRESATTLVMDQLDTLHRQDERIRWQQTMAGGGDPEREPSGDPDPESTPGSASGGGHPEYQAQGIAMLRRFLEFLEDGRGEVTALGFDEMCEHEGELPEYPYRMSIQMTASERLNLRLR
jgi:hypothetical protein